MEDVGDVLGVRDLFVDGAYDHLLGERPAAKVLLSQAPRPRRRKAREPIAASGGSEPIVAWGARSYKINNRATLKV